jgi:hypothetical protein
MTPPTRLPEIPTAQSISAAASYALVAHLLAAQVDLAAGSGWCATMNVAVAVAQHLLIELRSDGTAPSYLARKDGAPYQRAVDLLHTLDSYSNDALCPR